MKKRHHFAFLFALILAVAVSLIPLRGQAPKVDRVKQLGSQMMCMCGCNEILIECNHIDCQTSAAMLKELNQMIAANESNATILQNFVREYGQAVIASPPSTGFGSLAWYIPPMAFVLGLGIVGIVIRMWRNRELEEEPAAAGARAGGAGSAPAALDPEVERLRRQIEQETDD
jgi:cytochrome c-type biogenesis protein CcmH